MNQSTSNTNLVKAVEALREGKLFFFAGSGISYASHLPRADQILEATAQVMLPPLPESEVRRICSILQPELFYEIIIGTTGTRESLHLWSSLHSKTQERLGVNCYPNIAHFFIVEQAINSHWPIFTTNFDYMFEAAASALNLEYKVFLPGMEPPPSHQLESGYVAICKLHGSIQDSQGNFTPESLWTTMSEISKVNTRWISYLRRCMTQGHLTFVGYSARDIDFFPYIKAFALAGDTKHVFWINKFPDDNSDQASLESNAVRVENMWPAEAFERAAQQLKTPLKSAQLQSSQQPSSNSSIDAMSFLSSLSTELDAKLNLKPATKQLIFGFLLGRLSEFNRAREVLRHLEAGAYEELSEKQKRELLLGCARLSHELSCYSSCRHYAKQSLKHSRSMRDGALDIRIQARCLLSEAWRMSIPSETYFTRGRGVLYGFLVFVGLHFLFTKTVNGCSMFLAGKSLSKLSTAPQQELIEHSIRMGAIIQRAVGSPKKGWPRVWRKVLERYWNRIYAICYEFGYAAGIANTRRFLYRLNASTSVKSESDNIYNLMTYSTGKELSARNLADIAVNESRFDDAKALYQEFISLAQKSGNRLNAIKGLLGIMYVNHLNDVNPLLDQSNAELFTTLTTEFEGRLWQRHFAYLRGMLKRSMNSIG